MRVRAAAWDDRGTDVPLLGLVALPSRQSRRSRTAPLLALVLVALVWGVAFSLVKGTLTDIPAASLVTWRFTVALLVLLIARPRCLSGLRLAAVARSCVLGCLLGAGFLLHTWGMERASVVSSAFITGTVVVFAPVVARVWLKRRLGRSGMAAVGLAIVGLSVITWRGAAFSKGELLIVGASILWACHLVALERWTRPGEIYAMTVIQMGVVAVLAAVVETLSVGQVVVPDRWGPTAGLAVLGAVATAAAFLLLTWAQSRTDATTAAVVLTLEPVFGAATAIVLGETLSWPIALGAAAVVAGTLVIVARTPREAQPHASHSG
jgi:drug/metabolite transporter (DMT)-like permease